MNAFPAGASRVHAMDRRGFKVFGRRGGRRGGLSRCLDGLFGLADLFNLFHDRLNRQIQDRKFHLGSAETFS